MTTATTRLLDWAAAQGQDVPSTLGRALVVAQQAHRQRIRLSGDPHIVHVVEVALIVTQQCAAAETVIAAVLHDVPDTPAAPSGAELRAQFGADVVDILDGYTKLEQLPLDPDLRSADRRVLGIKIAHRLHNMRTIHHLHPARQRTEAEHTCEVVAPLARDLGGVELGAELDRLSHATLGSTDVVRHIQPEPRTNRGSGALRGALRRCAGPPEEPRKVSNHQVRKRGTATRWADAGEGDHEHRAGLPR